VNALALLEPLLAALPLVLMATAALLACLFREPLPRLWSLVRSISALATVAALVALGLALLVSPRVVIPGLLASLTGAWIALLVQALGTVILSFSSRYLDGEPGQAGYLAALCGVLSAVHALVLADDWSGLIVAWAGVGIALQFLLCFYRDRPFAALAAHKKFLADRLADGLLIVAACCSYREVGSGSISALFRDASTHATHLNAQLCALAFVLAVAIRTAMPPVHGWLIQVMEAPTPVSALLHAGVVNLGGYLLIRFAPLLEAVPLARAILVAIGLVGALLGSLVMLTRISIKVRLAWSTLAQMGFMLLECGVGLYQLAALHLIGHSLYKAYAFLCSGESVRNARLRDLRGVWQPAAWSILVAPVLAGGVMFAVNELCSLVVDQTWPWWWSAALALAWAPVLWVRTDAGGPLVAVQRLAVGGGLLSLLSLLAFVGHLVPLGAIMQPHAYAGQVALVALVLLYLGTAMLQVPAWRARFASLRRQSYAGFYLDEAFTRLTLRFWPVRLPVARRSDAAMPMSIATRGKLQASFTSRAGFES